MSRVFLLAVLAVLAGGPVNAAQGFSTGKELYSKCQAGPKTVQYNLCAGYVAGISDAMNIHTLYGVRACHPQNASVSQMVDVVKKFLADNPETRHHLSESLVAIAISDAFPCPET